MSDARTEFVVKFKKYFREKSTINERGFCQRFNDRTVVGSLYNLGEKTSKLKAELRIDHNTWVCHVYVTDVNGNYISGTDALYTSFEQMMNAIKPLMNAIKPSS